MKEKEPAPKDLSKNLNELSFKADNPRIAYIQNLKRRGRTLGRGSALLPTPRRITRPRR